MKKEIKIQNYLTQTVKQGVKASDVEAGTLAAKGIQKKEKKVKQCTNIKEFVNQGHFFGTWSDDSKGFFGGAEVTINKDFSWTYGTVSWDGKSRLDLDEKNPHVVTFVDKTTIDVTREGDGEKWTLTKTVPDEENEMME